MAAMVNKVIIVGRLGRDPESRFTGAGDQVANFSVACGEKWKDKDGQPQERTEWYRIVTWKKLAEICQKFLVKGSLVYIEGRGQTREWEDKQGQKRQQFEVVANQMKILSGGKLKAGAAAAGEDGGSQEITDEDVPF